MHSNNVVIKKTSTNNDENPNNKIRRVWIMQHIVDNVAKKQQLDVYLGISLFLLVEMVLLRNYKKRVVRVEKVLDKKNIDPAHSSYRCNFNVNLVSLIKNIDTVSLEPVSSTRVASQHMRVMF